MNRREFDMLSGQELIDKNTQLPVALLSVAPASDWVVRQYTAAPDGSAVWSTVTPVVLPGYDDPDHLRERLKDGKTSEAEERLPGRHQRGRRGRPGDAKTAEAKKRLYERLDKRIEDLLRKAIVQAGFPSTLAACADLSWQLVGFRPGLDLATRYESPDHLKGKPRYHVRIHWKDATGGSVNVRGPVAIGAGRYCGLGLFARGG
jgi:CRISPR-associated protein Csb2